MLDQRTLLVGYSTTTLILSLALLLAARSQRRYEGLDLWSCAGLLVGLVPLEVTWREMLAPWLPWVLTHLTALAGIVCLRAGISRYLEREFPLRRYLGLGLVWLTLDSLAEWTGVPMQFRTGVVIALVSATALDTGLQLVRSPHLWSMRAHRVTARLMLLLALLAGLRAAGVTAFGRLTGPFGPGLVFPYGLLGFQALHAAIGVSLMMMVWSRLSSELQGHVDRLEEELLRDSLTGALNRRGLQREAVPVFADACQQEQPVSLICLDIDHFKYVNDAHGHDVGDAVLRILVATIQPHLRIGDRVARMGGEEFAVLLPGTGQEAALAVAERLRRSVEESSVSLADGALRFTCSFGVAGRRPDETELAPLLTRADHALYEAKRSGRNRVCRADAGALLSG
jgi:diguanylate cyclase (GGDEF)-like protein